MASNESSDLFHCWICDLCRPWLRAVVWGNLWGLTSKMAPQHGWQDGVGCWLAAWLRLRAEGCGYFSVDLFLGTWTFSPKRRSRGWWFPGIWTKNLAVSLLPYFIGQADAELRFKGSGQTPQVWSSVRNWGLCFITNNIFKKGKKLTKSYLLN